MSELFHKFAAKISQATGTAGAFVLALSVILLWALTGPFFDFSNTWQLVINTSTTIVTFLMVFLIQNTQNRDAKAVHLKLDELLKADKGARSAFVNIEELSDKELEDIHQEFRELHQRTQTVMQSRGLKIQEVTDREITQAKVVSEKKES